MSGELEPMTKEDEARYITAQDLTRVRIAYDVLKEVMSDDERRTRVLQELSTWRDELYADHCELTTVKTDE